MSTDRSKPLYPTEGPGDGRTWHEYFEDLKPREADDSDVDDGSPVPGSITVTTPAHEVAEGEPIPRALVTWRNRLLANGWRFKIGHSVAFHEDSYYLNGNLRAAAHEEHQWWINAINGNTYITISYNVVDGKVNSARTILKTSSSIKRMLANEMQELIES